MSDKFGRYSDNATFTSGGTLVNNTAGRDADIDKNRGIPCVAIVLLIGLVALVLFALPLFL